MRKLRDLFKRKKPKSIILETDFISEVLINEHINFIEDLIHSELRECGFSDDEYMHRLISECFDDHVGRPWFNYIMDKRLEPNDHILHAGKYAYVQLPFKIGNVTINSAGELGVFIDTFNNLMNRR